MKIKVLRVTYTEDYLIEMFDDKRTEINGWTMEEVIDDWFNRVGGVGGYHATRDGHRIGNSRKYLKSEIVKSIEDEWKTIVE